MGRPRKNPLPSEGQKSQAASLPPLLRTSPAEDMAKTALWCAVKVLDQCNHETQPSRELVDLVTTLIGSLRNETSEIKRISDDVQGLRNAVTRIGNVVGLSKTIPQGSDSQWQPQRAQSAG